MTRCWYFLYLNLYFQEQCLVSQVFPLNRPQLDILILHQVHLWPQWDPQPSRGHQLHLQQHSLFHHQTLYRMVNKNQPLQFQVIHWTVIRFSCSCIACPNLYSSLALKFCQNFWWYIKTRIVSAVFALLEMGISQEHSTSRLFLGYLKR